MDKGYGMPKVGMLKLFFLLITQWHIPLQASVSKPAYIMNSLQAKEKAIYGQTEKIKHSVDKSNPCSIRVDLPDIKFLVFTHASFKLIWCKAFCCTTLMGLLKPTKNNFRSQPSVGKINGEKHTRDVLMQLFFRSFSNELFLLVAFMERSPYYYQRKHSFPHPHALNFMLNSFVIKFMVALKKKQKIKIIYQTIQRQRKKFGFNRVDKAKITNVERH